MAQRILVIDDDQFIREIYEDVLKQEGYLVDTATDGEDGFIKLQAGGYDLILLDVNMPKMNGLQVLEQLIKNPPQVKNGSIILLTNSSDDDVVTEGLKKGASNYFVKADLTPNQLLDKINEIFSKNKLTTT